MRFKVFRTYEKVAELEENMEIDIPTSSVDEFSQFYTDFTNYLSDKEVIVSPEDMESATYLRQFRPRKFRMTDEMTEVIMDCKEKGLSPFQTTFHLFENFGVEVRESVIENKWNEVAEAVPVNLDSETVEAPVPF